MSSIQKAQTRCRVPLRPLNVALRHLLKECILSGRFLQASSEAEFSSRYQVDFFVPAVRPVSSSNARRARSSRITLFFLRA